MRVELIETIKAVTNTAADPIRVKIWDCEIEPWKEIDPDSITVAIEEAIRNCKATNHAPVSLAFDVIIFVNGTGHFLDPKGNLAAQLASWSIFDYSQYDQVVRAYESGKIKAARNEGHFMVRPKTA